MNSNFYKQVVICVVLFFKAFLCAASQFSTENIAEESHYFQTITSYTEVYSKVAELLANNISPFSIVVLTDWDNTINGANEEEMGAWSPSSPDRSSVRTEEEVDHRLRDPKTLDVIRELKTKAIKVIVTTARPPIRDLVAINTVQKRNGYNLFETRFRSSHPSQPNCINLEKIHKIINDLANGYDREELAILAREKITIMQERSGVVLDDQEGLQRQLIFKLDNRKVVYLDGFAFVGHDKGPAVLRLLGELNINSSHVIIVDDSQKALDTYEKLLGEFTNKNIKLFFLHYPLQK